MSKRKSSRGPSWSQVEEFVLNTLERVFTQLSEELPRSQPEIKNVVGDFRRKLPQILGDARRAVDR